MWTFDRVTHADREGHPTQKPVALMEHIVATLSRPGDTVLDPFLGSGSTLIACERLGRRCIGSEVDPGYVDIICLRYFAAWGRAPVHAVTGAQFPVGG